VTGTTNPRRVKKPAVDEKELEKGGPVFLLFEKKRVRRTTHWYATTTSAGYPTRIARFRIGPTDERWLFEFEVRPLPADMPTKRKRPHVKVDAQGRVLSRSPRHQPRPQAHPEACAANN
jgi:hypothetical protein